MSVRKEASGRRSIQVEVEVPGTPEQVWQAIATGPGVSSWFVPTEIEERAGGKLTAHFGPGMDSVATITEWDAPHRFRAESSNYMGPDAPAMGTEWTVEARDGGTCIVRVVHSLFAETDDWDNQLTGTEEGWPAFFRILRLYLTRFAGEPCSIVQVIGMAPMGIAETWNVVGGSLGLLGAAEGDRRITPAGTPALRGTVEAVHGGEHPFTLLFAEEPRGAACFNLCPMGSQSMTAVSLYLYGAEAAATAAAIEPEWKAWMAAQFPAAAETETAIAVPQS